MLKIMFDLYRTWNIHLIRLEFLWCLIDEKVFCFTCMHTQVTTDNLSYNYAQQRKERLIWVSVLCNLEPV